MANPQFDTQKRLLHLLTVEGWPRALLSSVLDRVDAIRTAQLAGLPFEDAVACCVLAALYPPVKHVDAGLALAARWCGWQVCVPPRELRPDFDTPTDIAQWCTGVDVLLLAHPASGAAHATAQYVPVGVRVLNVADGQHAAALAALSDLAELRRRLPELHTRTLALTGDLVADPRMRSMIHMLTTLGAPQVRVIHAGSKRVDGAAQLGVHVVSVDDEIAGMEGADAVLAYPVLPDNDIPLMLHGLPADDHATGLGGSWHDRRTFDYACVLTAVIEKLMVVR